MLTYVALPYQMYQLTHSSFAVGLLGLVELVPLLLTPSSAARWRMRSTAAGW